MFHFQSIPSRAFLLLTRFSFGDFHRQPINRAEHFFIGCTSVVQAIENIHMMLRAHTVNGGSDSQYLIIVGSEHSCILVLKQAQRSQIWRQAGHFLETCKQNRVKLRIQLLMSNKYALQKKREYTQKEYIFLLNMI